MITFDQVSANNNWNEILHNISFNIKKWKWIFFTWDDLYCKTKILNLILWEAKSSWWTITILWNQLNHKSSRLIQKHKQKFWPVLRHLKLIPSKTIYKNIEFVLYIKEKNRVKIKNTIDKILIRLGLEDKADYYPEELSAWDRQRACLARALVCDPKILVLDEITSHLDKSSRMSIFSFLKELKKENKITIIWSSNSSDIITDLADKVFEIKNWVIVHK